MPHTKWIKDLHVKAKTIKLLEENMEIDLHDFGYGNRFLEMTPKAQVAKGKINWTSSKLKIFAHQRTL